MWNENRITYNSFLNFFHVVEACILTNLNITISHLTTFMHIFSPIDIILFFIKFSDTFRTRHANLLNYSYSSC